MFFVDFRAPIRSATRFFCPSVAALFVTAASAFAVILYGTGDPGANTSAPTGDLAGSGWQYEGQFGNFLGTVIASNYFVTAKHIGGNVGNAFTFNQINYITTAAFPDPSSDLQVWRIAGSIPVHAPLYSNVGGSESGLELVVFGRGTQRGDAVLVGNDMHLGGWGWGVSDTVQRWGTNQVGAVVNDPDYGQLLYAPFDAGVGRNESHLSVGDSGGAVFVFNPTSSLWELAGINLSVDGPFSRSPTGANSFNAALFDTNDLFVQAEGGSWIPAPNPSGFYATEVAAHKGFVESVIMQLLSTVSRKVHGSAGTFDVDLPQSGRPGVECRGAASANDYTIVFVFMNNVSVQSASVTTGIGSVSSFSVVGNRVTVNLTGVTSAQRVVVTLANVSDGTNTSDVQATMDVLIGDTNGDGNVNASDLAQTKSRIGQSLDAMNFRSDVNANGVVNATDAAIIESNIGTGPRSTR